MENCDADHWCRHLRVAEIAHDWKGKAKAFTAKDAKGATEQKVSTAEGAEIAEKSDDKQRRGEKLRHLPQRARRAQRQQEVFAAECAKIAEKIMTQAGSTPRNRRKSERDRADGTGSGEGNHCSQQLPLRWCRTRAREVFFR